VRSRYSQQRYNSCRNQPERAQEPEANYRAEVVAHMDAGEVPEVAALLEKAVVHGFVYFYSARRKEGPNKRESAKR
jgi:hypothetical protein